MRGVFASDYTLPPRALFARLSLWLLSYEDWGDAFLHFPLISDSSQEPSWVLDFDRPFEISRASFQDYAWKHHAQKSLIWTVCRGLAYTVGFEVDKIVLFFEPSTKPGDSDTVMQESMVYLWKLDRHSLFSKPLRRIPEEWEADSPTDRAYRNLDRATPWESIVEWSCGNKDLPTYEDDPVLWEIIPGADNLRRVSDHHPMAETCQTMIVQFIEVLAAVWCITIANQDGESWLSESNRDPRTYDREGSYIATQALLQSDSEQIYAETIINMPGWYVRGFALPLTVRFCGLDGTDPLIEDVIDDLKLLLTATFSHLPHPPSLNIHCHTAHIPRLIQVILRSVSNIQPACERPMPDEQDDLLGCILFDFANLQSQLTSLQWTDRHTTNQGRPILLQYNQIRAELYACADETEFLHCQAWLLALIDKLHTISTAVVPSRALQLRQRVAYLQSLNIENGLEELSNLLDSLDMEDFATRCILIGTLREFFDDAKTGMQEQARAVTSLKSIDVGDLPTHENDGWAWQAAAKQTITRLCKAQCFALDSGFLGLCFEGRGRVRAGDKLVVLEGMGFPMVLRPIGEERAEEGVIEGRLVGPVVVRGIMNEELRRYFDEGCFV